MLRFTHQVVYFIQGQVVLTVAGACVLLPEHEALFDQRLNALSAPHVSVQQVAVKLRVVLDVH